MKKIVVSAVGAVAVMVGVLVARALGASEPDAVALALAVAVAIPAFAFAAVDATTFACAAFVAVYAFAAVDAITDDRINIFGYGLAAFVVATIVVFAACASAEQKRIKFRWAFIAYAIEALVIGGGAFMIGSAGWSAAIAFAGIIGLFVLWCFASESNTSEQAAIAAPEHNGA